MKSFNKYPAIAIVKPTKRCNLDCTFCYESHETSVMDTETLEHVIKKVIAYNIKVSIENSFDLSISDFIWHGGEPLSMGIDYFKKIIELQNHYTTSYKDHVIRNEIQSNLTLLTPELWNFLKENKFKIGSSLDGNKELHDSTRRYKDGSGSFDRVMQVIHMIRNNPAATSPVGCIAVLTRDKLGKIKEMYNFFKRNKISFELNYLAIAGNAKIYRDVIEVSPEEWAKCMTELFDLWFFDRSEPFIEIPSLAKYAAGILMGKMNSCTFSGTCRNRYIAINPNGDVHPCGKFGADEGFKLGNIKTHSIDEIMESEVNKYLLKRKVNDIKECNECEFKEMCRGGCFYNAYLATGSPFEKDSMCSGYKIIFGHIKKVLEEILGDTSNSTSRMHNCVTA